MLPPHIKAHQFSGEIPAENFPCTLGGKSKSVSFSRVYVHMCKGKTNTCFFYFFYAPSPDHGRVNVALDHTIILGLEIFLDHFVP